jgi:hypothetical protein
VLCCLPCLVDRVCQDELREIEPQLVATEKEVDEMIVTIDADKASAADTKVRRVCACVCVCVRVCACVQRVTSASER